MDNNLRGVPVEGFADKSREAAVEGIVLLKNENNTLPLTEQDKVSVFGRPMIEYYRSGTGSGGAVNVEYTTNILDGFENSNLNFNKTIVEDYKEWLKDHPFDNGGGGWACEPWFQKDMEITADYAKKQAESTNKAVYIIGRTAGEDKDNANWVGSYLLTDEEKENLKNITEAFEDVCVVLNVSNIIDLKWIDEEQFKGHIKSVIIVWQGGMEGGNAVADALSGKATPSGKLPDTVAYDIYGLTEIEGPGVAFECEEQNGMHICEDYFIPEIVDPDTFEPVPDGQIGELVFTSFAKEAFPLIRYRTKDITYITREKCKCGRTHARIHRLMGRSDDMLIIKGVNVYPSQVEEVLIKQGMPANYQLIVDRVNNSDTMEVLVEMTPEMFSDTVSSIESKEKDIVTALKSMLGIYAKVKLVEPKSITRSEGKAVRVIDKRKI